MFFTGKAAVIAKAEKVTKDRPCDTEVRQQEAEDSKLIEDTEDTLEDSEDDPDQVIDVKVPPIPTIVTKAARKMIPLQIVKAVNTAQGTEKKTRGAKKVRGTSRCCRCQQQFTSIKECETHRWVALSNCYNKESDSRQQVGVKI